ncbi:MAG: hypothetical protein JSS57_04395 [Proteobacteria bacterium]|nr:hypothetical protein [Pseudomonadota bacterium]
MGIYLNDDELLLLSNASGIAVKAYLRMRARMDLRTRLVGVMSGLNWKALMEWTETTIPKGGGVQVEKPSESAVRRAVAALERVGLVQKRKSAVLVFSLPLASAGEVRPKQTRQETDRGLSTKPDTDETQHSSGFAGGFEVEPGTTENAVRGSNPTHIGDLRFTSPQSSSTEVNEGGASGDDAAPGGAYRDRPAGSHPAQSGRFGSRSGPDCMRLHEHLHEPPAGLAENESTAADCADDGLMRVLMRRGIRVPAASAAALSEWVAQGVTPLELDGAIEAALAARRKADSVQPVPLAYVGRVIHSRRSEARRAAEAARRALTHGKTKTANQRDFDALARELGLSPRPGEWPQEWTNRVLAAAEARMRKDDDAR